MEIPVNEKNRLAQVVGLGFTEPEGLTVCEKKQIQAQIKTLITFFALGTPVNKADGMQRAASIRFLVELAKEVGPAIGKYAQYEYGYDLHFAQNTHDSLEGIAKKLEETK